MFFASSVAVDAGSLSFLTLTAGTAERATVGVDRRAELDYGVCSFDAAGRPVQFFDAPVDQVLTSADYARALEHGFPHVVEFPATEGMALARFVVRDRATGNLGATDVQLMRPEQAAAAAEDASQNSNTLAAETAANLDLFDQFEAGRYMPPPRGPIGSFGSIVPAAQAFCGDVYELEKTSSRLPDFRELDPIGSIYTASLDVPDQLFTNTSGIPGVTPRTNLFGIDYHAVFWIRNPGDYEFRMVADDGAILHIDDREVINADGLHVALGRWGVAPLEAGRHTVHVEYYQGEVTSVALELWVRAPGESEWRIFNLRDFAPPPGTAAGSQ